MENQMQTIESPTNPIEISDPKNISETWVNGPFNIMNLGGTVLITFIVTRPDIGEILAGKQTPTFKGAVAARIMMPIQMAGELVRVLGQNLATTGPVAGHA
jgi:hypothetical protein